MNKEVEIAVTLNTDEANEKLEQLKEKSPSRAQLGEKEGGPEVIFPVSDLARLPKPDHY